ncbi:hypothetical protein J2X85_001653 [Microbacterium trichothecenolyticum]|nr:hypothetical protein [Microbacterium trichothecenolyticum]
MRRKHVKKAHSQIWAWVRLGLYALIKLVTFLWEMWGQ